MPCFRIRVSMDQNTSWTSRLTQCCGAWFCRRPQVFTRRQQPEPNRRFNLALHRKKFLEAGLHVGQINQNGPSNDDKQDSLAGEKDKVENDLVAMPDSNEHVDRDTAFAEIEPFYGRFRQDQTRKQWPHVKGLLKAKRGDVMEVSAMSTSGHFYRGKLLQKEGIAVAKYVTQTNPENLDVSFTKKGFIKKTNVRILKAQTSGDGDIDKDQKDVSQTV